jgi:hypothetical protein
MNILTRMALDTTQLNNNILTYIMHKKKYPSLKIIRQKYNCDLNKVTVFKELPHDYKYNKKTESNDLFLFTQLCCISPYQYSKTITSPIFFMCEGVRREIIQYALLGNTCMVTEHNYRFSNLARKAYRIFVIRHSDFK